MKNNLAHLGRNDAVLEHLQTALENGYADFEELAGMCGGNKYGNPRNTNL